MRAAGSARAVQSRSPAGALGHAAGGAGGSRRTRGRRRKALPAEAFRVPRRRGELGVDDGREPCRLRPLEHLAEVLRDVAERDLSDRTAGATPSARSCCRRSAACSSWRIATRMSRSAVPPPRSRAVRALEPGVAADGGGRRHHGRRVAVVPAVLERLRRAQRVDGAPRRGVGVRGDRGDARHAPPRLARARSRPGIPAVHARPGHRAVHLRPGVRDLVRKRVVRGGGGAPRPKVTPTLLRSAFAIARSGARTPLVEGGVRAALRSPVPRAAIETFLDVFANPALQWSDLARLREDGRACRCCSRASCCIRMTRSARSTTAPTGWSCPTGGRQVDGAVAALDALPGVAERVAGRVPIVLDSGVRGGADAVEALALGATAVGIGRPYAYPGSRSRARRACARSRATTSRSSTSPWGSRATGRSVRSGRTHPGPLASPVPERRRTREEIAAAGGAGGRASPPRSISSRACDRAAGSIDEAGCREPRSTSTPAGGQRCASAVPTRGGTA